MTEYKYKTREVAGQLVKFTDIRIGDEIVLDRSVHYVFDADTETPGAAPYIDIEDSRGAKYHITEDAWPALHFFRIIPNELFMPDDAETIRVEVDS